MKQLDDFIAKYFDQPNVGDTDANKGQCVGLVEVWADTFNLPHTWGNAKDLLTNADPNSFDIIQNTPNNIPVAGDIFVFGESYGSGNGHTGIVVNADVNLVSIFEQNDGLDNGTPQLKTYTYDGALGWLHIKNIPQDTTEADLQACLTQHDQLVTQCDQLQATINNLNNLTKQKDSQISQLSGTISSLESQLTDSQTALQSAQDIAKQVPTLTGELNQCDISRTRALNDNVRLNQENANLKQTIANGKPKTFFGRLQYLFSK